MFVVFYTLESPPGYHEDYHEVHETRETADTRAGQLAAMEGVVSWGVGSIIAASEPHWVEG